MKIPVYFQTRPYNRSPPLLQVPSRELDLQNVLEASLISKTFQRFFENFYRYFRSRNLQNVRF